LTPLRDPREEWLAPRLELLKTEKKPPMDIGYQVIKYGVKLTERVAIFRLLIWAFSFVLARGSFSMITSP
jgi:hypothetical protein